MGMPQARQGDMTSGHTSYQPVQLSVGSSNVFINGKPQIHQGLTQTSVHPPIGNVPPDSPFNIDGGSSTVLINSNQQSRLMDMTTCGQAIIEGSPNVLIG